MSLNSRNNAAPPAAFNVPLAPVALTGLLVVVHIVRAVLPSAWTNWIDLALAFMPLRYDPSNSVAALPGGYVTSITSFLTTFFLQSDPGTLMMLAGLFGSGRWIAGQCASATAHTAR